MRRGSHAPGRSSPVTFVILSANAVARRNGATNATVSSRSLRSLLDCRSRALCWYRRYSERSWSSAANISWSASAAVPWRLIETRALQAGRRLLRQTADHSSRPCADVVVLALRGVELGRRNLVPTERPTHLDTSHVLEALAHVAVGASRKGVRGTRLLCAAGAAHVRGGPHKTAAGDGKPQVVDVPSNCAWTRETATPAARGTRPTRQGIHR